MTHAATVGGIREIAEGRLYALGGAFPLDGRVSWVPAYEVGYQATNCYLLKQGDSFTLIDPGPAYQSGLLVEQLRTLMPPGAALSVYLTRAEWDCWGSLDAVAGAFRLDRLIAGGGNNPFDAFDSVGPTVSGSNPGFALVPMNRLTAKTPVAIGEDRKLIIVLPLMRLLSTYWAYDTGTKSLFTSDLFSHFVGRTMDEALAPSSVDIPSFAQVRDHLFAKMWWVAHAHTPPLRENLSAIFESVPIENICPDRGRVIRGAEAVQRSYRLVLDVLDGISVSQPGTRTSDLLASQVRA